MLSYWLQSVLGAVAPLELVLLVSPKIGGS